MAWKHKNSVVPYLCVNVGKVTENSFNTIQVYFVDKAEPLSYFFQAVTLNTLFIVAFVNC